MTLNCQFDVKLITLLNISTFYYYQSVANEHPFRTVTSGAIKAIKDQLAKYEACESREEKTKI